ADATFHCHRNFYSRAHGGNAIGHELRLGHEAGPQTPLLNTIRGAADIEIDFAIAVILTNSCCLRKHFGIAAAKLEGHRLLRVIKTKELLPGAMANGLGGDHLRIKQGVPREMAMEDTAMPVRPIHHGRHTKSV